MMVQVMPSGRRIRRDCLGRILHTREYQRKDGLYEYAYYTGKERSCVYSRRLNATDPVLPGMRDDLSLREKEEEIARELLNGRVIRKSKITVHELASRYISMKTGARASTSNNYRYILKIIEESGLGGMKIGDIHVNSAREWFIRMHEKEYKYNTLRTFKGVLKPAFAMAMGEGLISSNPFDFRLSDIVLNDSEKREALSPEEVADLMAFAESDPVVKESADGMQALFESGLRVSEFCGLTENDIDLENGLLHVERQLVTDGKGGCRVEEPKTSAGKRVIPMTKSMKEVFKRILTNRRPPANESVVNGVKGFLFVTAVGKPYLAHHWQTRFATLRNRYKNATGKTIKVSPHVCRHTFCSIMAMRGIAPKTLQYIMGHSSISVTMDVYTHLRVEKAKAEVMRLNM